MLRRLTLAQRRINARQSMLSRHYPIFLFTLLCAGLWSQPPSSKAAQARQSNDNQTLTDVKRAVQLARPNVNVDDLEMWERKDLEQDLSRITGKTARPVSFYSLYDTESSSDDGSLWAVVWSASNAETDDLYGFENSDDLEQASEKFNGLLSRLGPSITDEKAMRIAQLFLGCCAQGASGEPVTDEIDLRDSVASYYFQIYGNIWRSLDAYSQWWESYEKTALDLAPTFAVKGDVRRITLKRLRSSYGMHPQLQQWELAVSSDGSVRVLAVKSIFPKQRQWLSYDFRSSIE